MLLHKNPTKKESFNGALIDGYHTNTPNSSFKIGSIIGGYIQHGPERTKSSFYIMQGIGEAIIKGAELHSVVGGEIFELNENSAFKLDGQLKYITITNSVNTSIKHITNEMKFEENKKYFIYVLDGFGTAIHNNRKEILRENYFIELDGENALTIESQNINCLIAELA